MNYPKYLSYSEAWRRINAAAIGGFHFEAVTLCESIISDRLLSYILGVKPSSKANLKTHFHKLIAEWRALAAGALPKISDALDEDVIENWKPLVVGEQLIDVRMDLGEAVDLWRRERNIIVHGLVKSEPGQPTSSLPNFLQRAELAATVGVKLAREVSNWHRQQLAAQRSEML